MFGSAEGVPQALGRKCQSFNAFSMKMETLVTSCAKYAAGSSSGRMRRRRQYQNKSLNPNSRYPPVMRPRESLQGLRCLCGQMAWRKQHLEDAEAATMWGSLEEPETQDVK